MEAWLGVPNPEGIAAWAKRAVTEHADSPNGLHRLSGLAVEKRVEEFMRLVQNWYGFDPLTQPNVDIAVEILRDLCARALDREVSLDYLNRAVQVFDANVVVSSRALEYPIEVEALWNALDWCDVSWTIDNQPHIADALRAAAECRASDA